jgi:hypothetical protein
MKSMISATARDEKIIDKKIEMQRVHNKVLTTDSQGAWGDVPPESDFGGQNQSGAGCFGLSGESRRKRREYDGE